MAWALSWQPHCVGALRWRVITTPLDVVEMTAVWLHGGSFFWSRFLLFCLLEWDIKSHSWKKRELVRGEKKNHNKKTNTKIQQIVLSDCLHEVKILSLRDSVCLHSESWNAGFAPCSPRGSFLCAVLNDILSFTCRFSSLQWIWLP